MLTLEVTDGLANCVRVPPMTPLADPDMSSRSDRVASRNESAFWMSISSFAICAALRSTDNTAAFERLRQLDEFLSIGQHPSQHGRPRLEYGADRLEPQRATNIMFQIP